MELDILEESSYNIHHHENLKLISRCVSSSKLTQIFGQFLQAFPFIQTADAEQTAT
jgi:hypothetical protein